MLPSLVDATDLVTWAHRLDARGRLPELVRRLIVTTARDVTRLGMRAGEGTQFEGWDGLVQVGEGNAFVPAGLSAWEMGADQKVKSKAESDFEKRTKNPLGIEPSTATFVFVSPRRWAGKDDWASEKIEAGPWADVRVLDADDLQLWLELSPVVHAWISQHLGKAPSGIQVLESFWTSWREATIPPLSAELLLAGRQDAAEQVASHLMDTPSALTVRGDSQDESLAFIGACIEKLPAAERESIFSRALVVHDAHAWRQISLTEQPIVLVPTFTQPDLAQATHAGHHVVVPTGRETADSADLVDLPRLNRDAAETALKALGVSDHRVGSLASLARRSLLSLRRKLALNPELQQPAWAHSDRAYVVLPAVLAGSWNESLDGDREVLAALAGRPYDEFIKGLSICVNESDPPVRRVGSTWLLVSKEDTWRLLARFLTRSDVERFQQVVAEVLGAVDPALELPADQRWTAAAVGKARPHSNLLREGLADTLALMAARAADVSLPEMTVTGQDYATVAVRQLLQRANQDQTGFFWSSLADVLPLLGEAAPEPFLEAVDAGSDGKDSVLPTLFADQPSNSFASSSPHPGLLWALERSAWAPRHLSHAALLLARLARLDPGGRLKNRPSESLLGIFRPWHPQTAATIEERLQVIDMLRQREPDAAWSLMVSMLPQLNDVATPTNAPRWREWRPEGVPSVTYGELWKTAEEVVNRLLQDVGRNGDRISQVAASIGNLPPSPSAAVLDFLEAFDASTLTDAGRRTAWTSLRRQVAQHRRFATAKWSMPADQVERLATLYQRFEPTNVIDRTAWLFSQWPELPEVEAEDFHKQAEAVFQAQVNGCKAVYEDGGLEKVFALAEAVEHPWVLGRALGKSGVLANEASVLRELATPLPARRQLASGYVVSRFWSALWPWVDEKLGDADLNLTPAQRAELLRNLPSGVETWNRVEQYSVETAELYWASFSPPLEDPGECLRAVDQLVRHGQAWVALDLLALYVDDQALRPTADQVMGVLEAAMETPMTYQNSSLRHDVAKLLDYINECEEVDEGRLARIEWAFLPLFRFENRPMRVLHHRLAIDPSFFTEVVCLVFKARDDEPRNLDEAAQHRAQTAYELLDSWHEVPGSQGEAIDDSALTTWVESARTLLREEGRTEIGEQRIGHVLRYAKADADGSWPPQVVRDLIESVRSSDLELGLSVELHNSRGFTWRGMADGGKQEWDLAKEYHARAQAVGSRWPRTAAMLRRIASDYERDARRQDASAELDQDRW